jgi:hypothetical protein
LPLAESSQTAPRFQGLETETGGFSKPWNFSPDFFRALENGAEIFPRLGKWLGGA